MEEPIAAGSKTCPSSSCAEGALLIGVVGPAGRVAYITPSARLTAAFVAELKVRGAAEQRFRFAAACVESGCTQWKGERCNVIDRVLLAQKRAAAPAVVDVLPRCSIRQTCRWFSQTGAEACRVCPLVVTDSRGLG